MNGSSAVVMKLMLAAGWDGKSGLGRKEQGIKQPISLTSMSHRRSGVGVKPQKRLAREEEEDNSPRRGKEKRSKDDPQRRKGKSARSQQNDPPPMVPVLLGDELRRRILEQIPQSSDVGILTRTLLRRLGLSRNDDAQECMKSHLQRMKQEGLVDEKPDQKNPTRSKWVRLAPDLMKPSLNALVGKTSHLNPAWEGIVLSCVKSGGQGSKLAGIIKRFAKKALILTPGQVATQSEVVQLLLLLEARGLCECIGSGKLRWRRLVKQLHGDASVPDVDGSDCRFGYACARSDCKYRHSGGRAIDALGPVAPPQAFWWATKAQESPDPVQRIADFLYGKPPSLSGPLYVGVDCKFGYACRRPGCHFRHLQT